LEPVDEQQEIVKLIKIMHSNGVNSSKIATTLNLSSHNIYLNGNKKTPRNNPVFYPEIIEKQYYQMNDLLNQRKRHILCARG
jgi:hypothetical protein